MKTKITALLAGAMCLAMATTSFAAGSTERKKATLPTADYTYEYVENCTIQLPGREETYTLENATAQVGFSMVKRNIPFTDEYKEVPTYYVSFIAETGRITFNQHTFTLKIYYDEFEGNGGNEIYEDTGYMQMTENDGSTKETLKYVIEYYDNGRQTVEQESDPDDGWDGATAEELPPDAVLVFVMGNHLSSYSSYCEYDEFGEIDYDLIPKSFERIDIETLFVNEEEKTPEYSIVSGANAEWKADSDKGLEIKCDGDFNNFTGIKVDGTTVDAKNYTVKEGSTIVELKADYLKTLSAGSHEITFVYTDGEVSTQFEVAAANTNTNNNVSIPNTSSGAQAIGGLAALSIASLFAIAFIAKKK
ncbi:MAG: X2-like carbohydrate binding domain-containing protein [Candidatus Fimenecus sp.]